MTAQLDTRTAAEAPRPAQSLLSSGPLSASLPALGLLAIGADPTTALVLSQVVLSFGIPFALIPLLRLTNDRALMQEQANGRAMRIALSIIVALVVGLNLTLIVLTVTGI